MKVSPAIRLTPVGKCIYCGKGPPECAVNDEHIIPFALGGNLILPQSSCASCEAKTHAFEGHCTGEMFKALRVHHKVPTRRPKKRPTHLRVMDGKNYQYVPVDRGPGAVCFPILPEPTFALGEVAKESVTPLGFNVYSTTSDAKERAVALKQSGFRTAMSFSQFKPFEFGRVLAKIAHAAVAGLIGLDAFNGYLQPIIIGNESRVFHYVGSPKESILPDRTDFGLHQLATDTVIIAGVRHIFAEIRLFTYLSPLPPSYVVIVGEFPE